MTLKNLEEEILCSAEQRQSAFSWFYLDSGWQFQKWKKKGITDLNKGREEQSGNQDSSTPEAYAEPCQTSKMEHFPKIVNRFFCQGLKD